MWKCLKALSTMRRHLKGVIVNFHEPSFEALVRTASDHHPFLNTPGSVIIILRHATAGVVSVGCPGGHSHGDSVWGGNRRRSCYGSWTRTGGRWRRGWAWWWGPASPPGHLGSLGCLSVNVVSVVYSEQWAASSTMETRAVTRGHAQSGECILVIFK